MVDTSIITPFYRLGKLRHRLFPTPKGSCSGWEDGLGRSPSSDLVLEWWQLKALVGTEPREGQLPAAAVEGVAGGGRPGPGVRLLE